MSDNVRPELAAYRELETLVHHLAEELAGFRRRALMSESRVRDLEEEGAEPTRVRQRELAERCSHLQVENESLRRRLDVATSRARQMLDRVRFIRQQTQGGLER